MLRLQMAVFAAIFCLVVEAADYRLDSGSKEENEDLISVEEYSLEEQLCYEPIPPANGWLTCGQSRKKPDRFVCKGFCEDGYQFPNGKPKKRHTCDMKSGKWKPEINFPDCLRICKPPCQNGGECTEDNSCVCPPDFRGDRCQFSTNLCDPVKAFHVFADWKCNHTLEGSTCTLQCPQGTYYEHAPADIYRCSITGEWVPGFAPKCMPFNIIEPPSSHEAFAAVTGKTAEAVDSAVCASWNHLHYRTFDGGMYSFQGQCEYLLVKDCTDDSFAIYLNSGSRSSVILYVSKEKYILSTDDEGFPVVEYLDVKHAIPKVLNGLRFEILANYITVYSFLGFRLKWNGRSSVLVKAESQLKNKTCGLCGKFDNSAVNDFEKADGSLAGTVEDFVNSWTIGSTEEKCDQSATVSHPCSEKTKDRASMAAEMCKVIFESNFTSCHNILDPSAYYEACKMDYCACISSEQECICEPLSQYFRECIRLGGKLENGWRSNTLCPLRCPQGMVYKDCGSSCPKTCKGSAYDCEDDHCVDGCHCPSGTLLHHGQCIQKEECPCLHKGKEYKSGERAVHDCNACECHNGKWECTKKKCEARCSSVGDPHFTTFDGKTFEFLGACPVYLVYHQNFSVIQHSVPCSSIGSASETEDHTSDSKYCTKSITIIYLENSLVLDPSAQALFNNKRIENLPFTENGISLYMASSLFRKVELPNDLTVMWDGENRIYVDAPPTLFDQTKGLCGTFNHNEKDDFITPDGDIESDISIFASRWQLSETCHKRSRRSDAILCEMQPERMKDAVTMCSFLKTEAFQSCHSELNPDPFYRSCMSDMCTCSQDLAKCACSSFADYSLSCARRGIIVNWVDEHPSCKPSCDGGQIYQECSDPCKSSCANIAVGSQQCKSTCVQGCSCPHGLSLSNENVCIPISECPCTFQGKEYANGATSLQVTDICLCEDAVWKCRPASLKEMVDINPDIMLSDQSLTCSSNETEEYTSCVENCPVSCQNMHLINRCKTKVCKPGCRCKEGYVVDSDAGRCVKKNQCGCRHGGHRYTEGERITRDCNACVCKGSEWQCSEKPCPGICSVWGESHFKTYDGKIYDFHGTCRYLLTKGKLGKGAAFSVSVQSVPCSTGSGTCSRSFTIFEGSSKVALGKSAPLPKNKRSNPFTIFESELYVTVYTRSGVIVQWDRGTRVTIQLDPKWQNKVAGLCGNFNGIPSDDFQTPSGELPESEPSLFADSWKTEEFCPTAEPLTDACSIHMNRESWARKKCDVLKSKVFASCHSEVTLEPFYDRCVSDVCGCDEGGDCECFCTAVAAYAHECNLKGVHIKWRSQELCPIQCKECATYESCMTSCPVRTCENQVFLDQVSHACTAAACTEGCNPKQCPPSQIYENSKDYKCIPESQCITPCLEVNGKLYNEGERITDPTVGDACQACHCLRGEVVCTGAPCTTTVSPRMLNIVYPCRRTGWTPWINTPSTPGGDFELLDSPILSSRLNDFCDVSSVSDIECRVADSKEHYKDAGQNVICTLPDGLMCKDSEQNNEACKDYEIRLFCSCGAPTCTTGWTDFFSLDNPENNVDGSDEETIENIRKLHPVCPGGLIEDIECKALVNGALVDYKETGQFGLKCSKNVGFVCISFLQQRGQKCLDYQVRFYCSCEGAFTSTVLPFTTVSQTTTVLPSTPSVCPEGQVYDKCAYRCNQTCSAFSHQLSMEGKCPSLSTDGCIEGCRPLKNCEWPRLWRDHSNCVTKDECTCVIPEDNGLLVIVAPNNILEYKCEKCQCIDDNLECHRVPGCGVAETTAPPLIRTQTSTVPTTTEIPVRIKIEKPDCWTEWINIDSPTSQGGDFEVLPDIRRKFEFCLNPVKIECRTVLDKKPSSGTGQTLKCDLKHGLQCWNSNNGAEGCYNYEVRFFCPCEITTTVTTPTVLSTAPPAACRNGWTEWFNSHIPDAEGEYETIQSVRAAGGLFCSSEMISAVDCRTNGTIGPLQHGVICDLQSGLQCHNAKLSGLCSDYEVRFYCECPVSEATIPPSVSVVQTTVEPTRVPKLLACSYWSNWINENHPSRTSVKSTSRKGVKGGGSVTGDYEKKTLFHLQQEHEFCSKGYLSAIECRDALTDKDYSETGDAKLVCSLLRGFQCQGKYQWNGVCRDYKIRYFCNCEETSQSISVRPTLPTIPSKCSQYYDVVDGPVPLPDSSLKASSSATPASGPQSARLSSTKGFKSAGAWIPAVHGPEQYLEVDLLSVQPVYGVVTKGRNGGTEWVKSYAVLYSRDGFSYSYVRDESFQKPKKVFSGNYDSDTPVEHIFKTPFEARFVRIQPLTYMKQIALRLGLLGCAEGLGITEVTTRPSLPCTEDMGMQNGNIHDQQISFSSVRDEQAPPSSIRLNNIQVNANPGGWVADTLDTFQYVQIDFLDIRTLTAVVTQGRDLVPQWVTAFTISFSQDGKTWNVIRDTNGKVKIFSGNFDSDTPVLNEFPQPVRARYLRVNPVKWNNWIAMRLEVLGCYEPYPTTTVSEAVLPLTVTPTLPAIITGECVEPMGMADHLLPDSYISVSSSAVPWSGASRIGLNTHVDYGGTGGWVASPSDSLPRVFISFSSNRNLSGIITQGREDADMWVVSYTVEYSLDNFSWTYSTDAVTQNIVFPGNQDRNSPNLRLFDKTVTARYIRVTIKDYHNAPSLRMELLGCFVPYPEGTTTPSVLETTTEQCIEYGPWLSLSSSPLYGDEEPLDKIIHSSGICTNPLVVQCRDVVTKQDYTKTNQDVICDLDIGLLCENHLQPNGYCFDYEVRIGCWSCGLTTSPPTTTTVAPLSLCPETPKLVTENCPLFCPQNYSCDGSACVPYMDCPCFKEGKRFKAGDALITSDCQRCDCILGGYSRCKPITCSPCGKGQKVELDETCTCLCKGCANGTLLCPSNGQCLDEKYWCDGIIDCGDDEVGCPTTEPSVKTTTVVPPVCTADIINDEQDSCEMNMNSFKTFDGLQYQYEICDHILVREATNESFIITAHKICNNGSSKECKRYVKIHMDDMEIQLGPSETEVYFNGYKVPLGNMWLLSKRYPDLEIKKHGNHLVLVSYGHGFKVTWDSVQNAKIVVSKCLMLQLSGLCGFYSGITDDDLSKIDGTLVPGSEEFGRSWSIGDADRCAISVCAPELVEQAVTVCQQFYLPPFSNCSSDMNLAVHVEACLSYICECMKENTEESSMESCACEVYEGFVAACETAKGKPIGEWRMNYGCSPSCPSGQEWNECGPGCDLTCDNYRLRDSVCEEKCVPGCYCPDGLLSHNDQCVKPKMCQDCICRGHGDPNYITFDGQYFAFQGNCTYVLAQHQSGSQPMDFQVFGINVECPEEPNTSCTKGLKVVWQNYVIEKYKDEPVLFNGLPLDVQDSPYTEGTISVTFIPNKSTVVHVKEINLVVRYFDQLYGYNIELPSYFYYNKTEGLCGVCNFDGSDDFYHRDGFVTDDVEEFAYSWLIDNSREKCTMPHVVVPTPELSICNFTANPCEIFIDPTLYSKSCQNDVSYSINAHASMCRSKLQYAQQCCERGISLKEWLLESGCESSCPETMAFECTSACLKTCDNYKSPWRCDVMPVFTCACREDQVFYRGQCVSPVACETCDDQGHMVGDTWYEGPCTKCECVGNFSVICTITECSSPPVCQENEELDVVPPDPDTCCSKYICKYKKKACPDAPLPECQPGESTVMVLEDECPFYKCECKVELCPSVVKPVSSEIGEKFVLEPAECCPLYVSRCFPEDCPAALSCDPGYKLSVAEGKCCSYYTCIPKTDICLYQHKFEVVNGTEVQLPEDHYYSVEYKPGSSWNDGLCRKCSCLTKDDQLIDSCIVEFCLDPNEFPDADIYVREPVHVPNTCCPHYKRTACISNGIIYLAGQEWPSSEGDECKTLRCVATQSGEVSILERTIICDRTCPEYAVYVEAEPPKCCGHCKPIACEESGKIYEAGAVWQSSLQPCSTAECTVSESMAYIIYKRKSCPPVPDSCPEEYLVLDEDGCCSHCSIPVDTCTVVDIPAAETVNFFHITDLDHGLCSNSQPIKNMSRCSGQCESALSYVTLLDNFENACRCCLPVISEPRTVTLDCSDGTKLKKSYNQPRSCMCSSCGRELRGTIQAPTPY